MTHALVVDTDALAARLQSSGRRPMRRHVLPRKVLVSGQAAGVGHGVAVAHLFQ